MSKSKLPIWMTDAPPTHILKMRRIYFEALAHHPLRGKEVAQLNHGEREYITEFISNSPDDIHDYVKLISRMSITDARVRPKNRTKIWGLLLEAATAEVPRRPRRKWNER